MKTNSLKATTRTFKSGNSIAVRIPHEFNLEAGKTFEIKRRGRELVLVERAENLGIVVDILQSMPADFFAEPLEDPPPEPVESFDMEPSAIVKPAAKRRKR
jgi:virulence-associated protein VagC